MIGGEHYFQPPPYEENSLGEVLQEKIGEIEFFSTGRDALFSLLVSLPQKKVIYLPDLICESIYKTCVAANKSIFTYSIGDDFLNFSLENLINTESACILVVHYFGVFNEHLLTFAKQVKLTVISDATHMLFSHEKLALSASKSNYQIASLRKSGAFPDGGFVSSKRKLQIKATKPLRENFLAFRVAGLMSRGFSARDYFCDDENFEFLKKAEQLIDNSSPGPHKCSYISRRLLYTLDARHAADIIYKNMQVLARQLEGFCKFPWNKDTLSPYFCCIFRNRKERDFVRSQLASRQYYLPIHWETLFLPKPSTLSDRCLSIPCDNRYDANTMFLISEIIRSCIIKI